MDLVRVLPPDARAIARDGFVPAIGIADGVRPIRRAGIGVENDLGPITDDPHGDNANPRAFGPSMKDRFLRCQKGTLFHNTIVLDPAARDRDLCARPESDGKATLAPLGSALTHSSR